MVNILWEDAANSMLSGMAFALQCAEKKALHGIVCPVLSYRAWSLDATLL